MLQSIMHVLRKIIISIELFTTILWLIVGRYLPFFLSVHQTSYRTVQETYKAINFRSQLWAVRIPPGGFEWCLSPLVLITRLIYIPYPLDLR